MEIKWGGKGDEGPSCENLNEVHPANQDQLLSLECCTACTRQPIQINSITKGNAVARPDTLPGGQIFTTGTINELSTVLVGHQSPQMQLEFQLHASARLSCPLSKL